MGADNDQLDGGYGNDFVEGGNGDDIITDLGGDDTLHGNEGNDVIQGGNGINLILGGPGKDFVVSGSDSTEVFGGTGDDVIYGGRDNDTIDLGGATTARAQVTNIGEKSGASTVPGLFGGFYNGEDTVGRFYTVGCDRLPSARGHGEPIRLMIELGNDQDIICQVHLGLRHGPRRPDPM